MEKFLASGDFTENASNPKYQAYMQSTEPIGFLSQLLEECKELNTKIRELDTEEAVDEDLRKADALNELVRAKTLAYHESVKATHEAMRVWAIAPSNSCAHELHHLLG